ncbi:KLHL24 [Branchiostoma lanceolatum]|uniref:KLHL24 protein n=1 Tax=Branchiostoma lanceolatum TaxID=7740 RepID=A0A8K0ELA0_BRALA|nr:KLHL24 [Branchiostoma lanceolatum]
MSMSSVAAFLAAMGSELSSHGHQLEDDSTFHHSLHAADILDSLNDQRLRGQYTDVVVCADGVEFPCHRAVLAASVPYFSAMFGSDMKDSNAEKVEIKQVKASVMGELVQYVYTGRVRITSHNAQALLEAACMFQCSSLRDGCCRFLTKNLDPCNCLGVQHLADALSCTELYTKAREFSLQHFLEVAQHQEILQIPEDSFVELLSSDDINTDSEEAVFEVAMAWVRYDVESRKDSLAKVMSVVRLPLVRSEFLLDTVETDSLVRDSKACQEFVVEARRYQLLTYKRHELQSPRTRPRLSTGFAEVMLVLGGEYEEATLNTVHYRSPITSSWIPLKSIPRRNEEQYSVVTLVNDIYLIGGVFKGRPLCRVCCYDSCLDDWRFVASLLVARYRHGSCVLKGQIYVVGGFDGNKRLSQVEKYDPSSNQWQATVPLPTAVSSPAVATCQDRMFVMGGVCNDGSDSSLVQIFDPDTVVWETVELPLIENRCAVAVVMDAKIYLIGGFSNKVLVLDPSTMEVYRVADMNIPRTFHAATSLAGKIYVAGGKPDSVSLPDDSIESYDPSVDQWDMEGTLPCPLYLHGMAAIHKYIGNEGNLAYVD